MNMVQFKIVDDVMEDAIRVFKLHRGQRGMRWTPSRNNVYYALKDYFPNKIMASCDTFEKTNFFESCINPSQHIKATHSFQTSTKITDIEVEKITKYFLKLANFGVVTRNYWNGYYKKKLENHFYKLNLSNLQSKDSLAYLCALLRALSETLYCDDHVVGGDFFGPYIFDNNQYIIRRYNRLRPLELYGDILKDFPFNQIEVIAKYNNKIQISTDFIGNILSNLSYKDELEEFAVFVIDKNGEKIDYSLRIDEINQILSDYVVKLISYFRSLSLQEQKLLVLYCAYYTFEPMFKTAGIDWRPSDIERNLYLNYSSSYDKEIEIKLNAASDDAEINRIIKQIVDPRVKMEELIND